MICIPRNTLPLPAVSFLPALALLLVTVTVTTTATAQDDLLVKPCGGALGQTITYEISRGRANAACLLISSLKRANIPLSTFDVRDTRTLGVGLESPFLNLNFPLNSQGGLKFSFRVPKDNVLIGLSLLHQAFTFPGKTTLVDEVSNVAVVVPGPSGVFRAEPKSMAAARSFATHIELGDGRHLVVGGGNGSLLFQTALATTEVYDAATRSFTAGPTMTAPRSLHAQVRLKDGRYLLIGGVDKANTPQTSCEFFDPKTNKFAAAPAMLSKRMGHTATLLSDGKVLVTGGIPDLSTQQAAVTSALRSTEIYDPVNKRWTAGPNLSTPRAMHAAVALGNDRVLLAGGLSWTTFFFFRTPRISNTTNLYDHKTGRMNRTGSMGSTRAMAAATLLPNGKVLIAGGLSGTISTTSGGAPIAGAEIYDPGSGSWSATTALSGPRALATGLVLSDGRFAVVGGGKGSLFLPTTLTSIEAFDPKLGKWAALPSLTTARAAAVVLELGACGILAIGGGTGNSASSVSSQELWAR